MIFWDQSCTLGKMFKNAFKYVMSTLKIRFIYFVLMKITR